MRHRLLLQPHGFEGFGVIPEELLAEDPAIAHGPKARQFHFQLGALARATPNGPHRDSVADIDEVVDQFKLVGIPRFAKLLPPAHHGLATHDENIIRQVQAFAIREKISRDSFEFQMLYGIRRDLQQQLVKDGWRMRVYVPFGTEWYPYFMRRLGERPANVFFVARNLLRS